MGTSKDNSVVVKNDATANLDSLKAVLFDTVKLVNSVSACVTSELLEKIPHGSFRRLVSNR